MSAFLFIVVLVILIVVHEFGHFIVAKLFGIRVDEFGIGYPPRAFTIGKWKGTTYTINWLPFGGFVKIFGERRDIEYTKENKKVAFVYKSKTKQALVLVAGVVFNLIFAWILFSATLMIGAPTSIDESEAGSLNTSLVVSSILAGSPADSAGLTAGDKIVQVSFNGKEVENLYPSEMVDFIQSHPGRKISISYVRELNSTERSEVIKTEVIPAHGVLSESPGVPAIGVSLALVATKKLSIVEAIPQGLVTTVMVLKNVTIGLVVFLTSIITATADFSQVAGPIGIAGLVGDASSIGFVYLMYFTAFISVNLAVINLIPLPALDGGRLLFIAIEAITKKPIKEKIAVTLNIVGFSFLILLMIIVTINDVIKLF